MDILVKEKYVVAFAPHIEFGVYDEDFEKWALLNDQGTLLYYAVDCGYTLVNGVELPADFMDGKYFYESGEFVLNEDWQPYVSPEDRIAELERQLANLNGDAVWDEMAVAIEEGVNEV